MDDWSLYGDSTTNPLSPPVSSTLSGVSVPPPGTPFEEAKQAVADDVTAAIAAHEDEAAQEKQQGSKAITKNPTSAPKKGMELSMYMHIAMHLLM